MIVAVMMARRATLWMLVVMGAGCLGRSFPIPPPQNVVQSVTECPPAQCPEGGVILRLSGVALENALVFAQDVSGPVDPTGQILPAGSARATAAGQWQITLGPQRDATGAVRAVQRGHLVDVFQVNDRGEASNTVTVLVR
jgi:hypothetical protein